MKKLLFTLVLLAISASCFSQEIEYKEYSYSEFFQMIESEKDSIFRLSNAVIKFKPKTDLRFKAPVFPGNYKDTTFNYRNDIVVDKHLELDNVQFLKDSKNENRQSYIEGAWYDIHFKKNVILKNTSSLVVSFSRFDEKLEFTMTDCNFNQEVLNDLKLFYIEFSTIKEFRFFRNCNNDAYKFSTIITGNTIQSKSSRAVFSITNLQNSTFIFLNNYVESQRYINIRNESSSGNYELLNNQFVGSYVGLEGYSVNGNLKWSGNKFSDMVHLNIPPLKVNDEVEWTQFKNILINFDAFIEYSLASNNRYPIQQELEKRAELISNYIDSVRYYSENIFSKEISLKGNFYNYYKNKYNTATANEVYLELKDFETERLKILFEQNRSFDSYFKWKINQFLKIFAAYGTEPAKAISMSVYVVLIFALVYLFFPNHWDSHGKDRILHRYLFFFKYLNKDAGMHDVYLDGKKDELAHYDGFKNFFIENGKTVPKFFLATALPLYRWSTASTRSTSWFLQKIDIFKGKWADLPAPQRASKTVLLTLAFALALLYDIFIKMLNALMLSINTFTTLGFGEIPIKGLPRYLAIIQGFIGWFMLTIFSVSLISQLLN